MKEFLPMNMIGKSGGKPNPSNAVISRILLLLQFTVMLVSCTSEKYVEKVVLEKGWKFQIDDKREFSNFDYNDNDWHNIEISKPWQQQGYDYFGFAWYRNKFFAPKPGEGQAYDSIKVFLGKITDSHQVFLNGKILGENGRIASSFTKADSTFTDKAPTTKDNIYVLSINDPRINLAQNNVLAVRVFNRRLTGGLIAGTPYIRFVTPADYIIYGSLFYRPDSTGALDTNLIITNSYKETLKGVLNIRTDKMSKDKQPPDWKVPLSLKSGESQSIPVSIPQSFTPVKIYLNFYNSQSKCNYKDSVVVPFVLEK